MTIRTKKVFRTFLEGILVLRKQPQLKTTKEMKKTMFIITFDSFGDGKGMATEAVGDKPS